MSIRSQRNVTVSAGDAAILMRALNRQRAGAGRSDRSVAEPRERAIGGRYRSADGLPLKSVPSVEGLPPRAVTSEVRLVPREARPDRERRRDHREHAERAERPDRAERSGRRGGPLSWIAARFTALSPRARTRLAVVVAIVALGLFFYDPAADLYAAKRDHDQLVQKVEATKAVAADLEAQVHRLQTEEGIMDEARIRGYANPGEVAVDASELLGIEDSVTVPELAKPIETEEPPLPIKVLDVLMGYEERTS